MYACISQNMDKEFPESMEIAMWMNASSLPARWIVECWWSYHSFTFAYFKPFLGLKYTASPDWSKKCFKLKNNDFSFEAVQKLAIFRYGRFEFKTISDKWLHKTDEEEKECKKNPKETSSESSRMKAADRVHCFWRKCFAVFDPEGF